MKKLTYVANVRIPTEKAHGIQIMKMCEAFANKGVDVELVIPRREKIIDADPFEYYSVKRNFHIKKLWCIDAVRAGRLGFLLQSLTFTWSAMGHLVFRKGNFYTRDELQALWLRLFGKKVAWEVHMGQINLCAKLNLMLKSPLVVITGGLKDLYVSYGFPQDDILVAHDAVDMNLFSNLLSKSDERAALNLPQNKKIISYIGKMKTMGKSKGIDLIVSTFKEVTDKLENTFLLIVGPDENEIKELNLKMRDHGIPFESYRVIPHVNHLKAPHYMRASDALLMAYPNTQHYSKYMSPLKLFEYMASGTSIVASDLPSLREVLDDSSAYFFAPDNKKDLESKITECLSANSNIRAVVALEKVREYTWQKRAGKILNFLGI